MSLTDTTAFDFTDPNKILFGALAIGLAAGIFVTDAKGRPIRDEDGDLVVDIDKVYYLVRSRRIDVSKCGRALTSTVGRIRASILAPLKSDAA
jgi:hypothetical protein